MKRKLKIGKTNILLILLLFGISSWTFSAEEGMERERLNQIEVLMDNNFGYSQDIRIDDIIQLEDSVVTYYQQKQDYKHMFLMKQMSIYAQSFKGQITEALKKAGSMLEQARQMKNDIGIALSYFAFGDTYLNAYMNAEAIEEYEKAIEILYKIPDSEQLQERVFAQLVPTLIKDKQMDKAQNYLKQMGGIYEDSRLNPFLYYIYQAFYHLHSDDLEKTRQYLVDAEQINNAAPSFFHTSILKYIQAEYAKKTGNYQQAIRLYTDLASYSNSINAYDNYLAIRKEIAKIYSKLGQDKEACETYQIINANRDSINAHSYTAQINLLRTVYQVDRLEMTNQKQWNRLLSYLIVGGILILVIFIAFVLLIKRENKRLSASKQKLSEAQKNAEASIRTKSLFLSNMSHEIRTPLNALSGFSSILTDSNIDQSIRQQCNDIIQQNSDLLMKLIDDVVDLSSLERGKMQFRMNIYDAVSLCRNVIDTVEKIKQTAATVVFETSLNKLELGCSSCLSTC